MGVTKFRIENQKALRLAECTDVPPVMVIAGPNGVGKSTLLHAIKRHAGQVQMTGRFIYLPPHRIWRRQQISMMALFDQQNRSQSLLDFLTGDSMPGLPGLRILEHARGPDSADEALSAVKYTLSRFETRKVLVYNRLVETLESVRRADLPDIYRPLRRLTDYLLPHLEFSRIKLEDSSNAVQCLFKRRDRHSELEIDLDDLSSGERAIISLFMPFLEGEIDRGLDELEGLAAGVGTGSHQDLVVLMDEPELHLHPALQARLLEYLREISRAGGAQFILSTHSPTLLSVASHTELFVLMPPTGNPTENQLVRLAGDADKLQAMRDLCGDTYVLTSCRSIICVEGEPPSPDTKIPTDVRLLELVFPEIRMHVLLPFGGKGQTIQAARRLSELLPASLPVVSVTALVDADQAPAGADAKTFIPLPVAMIENLLLVPGAVWDYLNPHHERCRLSSVDEVKRVLLEIAVGRRDDEIALRVQKRLEARTVRLSGVSVDAIKRSMEVEIERLRASLPDDSTLADIVASAEAEVDGIIARGEPLLRFHGKDILRKFHQRFVNHLGVGLTAFEVELARTVGRTPEYRGQFAEDLLPKLGILPTRLDESPAKGSAVQNSDAIPSRDPPASGT